jgi:hypothetical protein
LQLETLRLAYQVDRAPRPYLFFNFLGEFSVCRQSVRCPFGVSFSVRPVFVLESSSFRFITSIMDFNCLGLCWLQPGERAGEVILVICGCQVSDGNFVIKSCDDGNLKPYRVDWATRPDFCIVGLLP